MRRKSLLRGVRSRLVILALLLILQPFSAMQARAQTTRTILGTISDPRGEVIPNATITVTNLETNLERNTTTDETGLYRVTLLQVGR